MLLYLVTLSPRKKNDPLVLFHENTTHGSNWFADVFLYRFLEYKKMVSLRSIMKFLENIYHFAFLSCYKHVLHMVR